MNVKTILGLGALGGVIYLATNKPARTKTKKAIGLSDRHFPTPESALKYIEKNINKGKEKIINDSIHFGLGKEIYTYKEDAKQYKIAGKPGKNSTFVHLTKTETLKMLKGLMTDRGYLYSE
jgi:5-bromo-4-chloroindolyl phosphate hydrolysis protein